MLSRLTGRTAPIIRRKCSTAPRDSIIENMQNNARAYGLMLSVMVVTSAAAVNFLVSSHVYPISQEQKLIRQDMKEIRQEMTRNQKEMHQEMNIMRQEMTRNQTEIPQELHQGMNIMPQEMTRNQTELLQAISIIDDKYAMHGERLAKLLTI